MMARIASSTIESGTTISISIFGSRLTLYSLPRYTAVCPFCLPWPRTSVTVMPEMLSLPSASLTSSTLLGRTMALINFIVALQHAREIRRQLDLLGIGEFRAGGRDVEHVDRLLAFRGDEHEVDFTAATRDHAADPVQQPDRIVRDDV